ncbi:MAG: hypothetical protein V3U87_08750 [Methylococcaceae bacterium]
MSLSQEEKVACSELFFAITGETIPDYKWNPKGAAYLYKYIYELKNCSHIMAWVTKFPAFPVTSTNIKMLALKAGYYIYQVWQEYKKIEKKDHNARCSDTAVGYSNYPRLIKQATHGL